MRWQQPLPNGLCAVSMKKKEKRKTTPYKGKFKHCHLPAQLTKNSETIAFGLLSDFACIPNQGDPASHFNS